MKFLSGLQNVFSKKPAAVSDALALYKSAFDSTLMGYIVYSKDTQEITEVSKMMYKLLELDGEEDFRRLYISQILMRYLAGDSPNLETLLDHTDKDWNGEAVFNTHKKNKLYALVNTNILSGDEVPAYRILSVLDIGRLKESQKETESANEKAHMAATSKSRFLSSVSHELRTPLNGIVGAANLILTDPDVKSEVRDRVSLIIYSSEHMLGIINDILDFSKLDAQKMELNKKPFNLLKCLNNIYTEFSFQFKQQKLELKTDFPTDELKDEMVLGDETKLSQTLKNLLSNAFKFTIEGGAAIKVSIEDSTATYLTVAFAVSDTGVGIPKNKQDKIFQAFSQIYNDDLKRRYQGTGLGLTISSQIVKMMGGQLEVSSKENNGSTFFFTVKFKRVKMPKPEKADEPSSAQEKKDIRGVRALIVEDNEINASILRSFLTRWEMPVKEAITGVHALELIKYHHFDIILMDLEMPEMNGYTALKKIREQHITTPVIAFTATMLEDMDSLITEAGFTDYILKPFKPADLRKKIEKYCERKVDYV